MRAPRRSWRPLVVALGLGAALLALAHPPAGASDVWGNVAPASQLPPGGLPERYPLGHYALDQHFTAVEASLTGGVDVSGVPPMIAHFLANTLWELTAFLANTLIALFVFAFSLDLVRGSQETGGAGALGPVSAAIHSIYADVFGAPWLVAAVAIVGIWAMWRALIQRRYAETAGALGLSLVYLVIALAFVAQPAKTIGAASQWTNQMSEAFLTISHRGSLGSADRAKQAASDRLFSLLVYQPWTVLQFGGAEHCVKDGTGSDDEDPVSVAVRPLSRDPGREAALSRRLRAGTEVAAEGKTCINNANKYAARFLRHAPGSEERDAEYEALDEGDASGLPDAGSYRLGVADKPAADAMEQGGQYQRLLIALVVFGGELGAFALLGALSVGVILAQVLLLLLLAFAPVALVFAVIPGRGHDFFVNWLTKLASLLLRKAAYSLILAVLLAVAGALALATAQLGWLMSFGLQGIFFWAVLLQRRQLTDRLIGAAVGTGAQGRDGAVRLLALYAGARMAARPLRAGGRTAKRALRGARGRLPGGGSARGAGAAASGAARPGTRRRLAPGGAAPSAAGAREGERPASTSAAPPRRQEGRAGGKDARPGERGSPPAPARPIGKGGAARSARAAGATRSATPPRPADSPPAARPSAAETPPARAPGRGSGETPLGAELRAERERIERLWERREKGSPRPDRGPAPPVRRPQRRPKKGKR